MPYEPYEAPLGLSDTKVLSSILEMTALAAGHSHSHGSGASVSYDSDTDTTPVLVA